MKFRVSVISHIGNVRAVNQDNFCCLGRYRSPEEINVAFDYDAINKKLWLTAVFDGMGGENDGEIASLMASELVNSRSESGSDIDIGSLILSINAEICREMLSRKNHMGSTCVFVEFDDASFRSWNIGDSRAYHYHRGTLKQISEDHTEAAFLNEFFKGEATAKAGSENTLTQYLGIPEDDFIIEPYVSSWEYIENGDIMMLCTDGLTHMSDDRSILNILVQDISIHEKNGLLLDAAMKSGGKDNITIILVEAYS